MALYSAFYNTGQSALYSAFYMRNRGPSAIAWSSLETTNTFKQRTKKQTKPQRKPPSVSSRFLSLASSLLFPVLSLRPCMWPLFLSWLAVFSPLISLRTCCGWTSSVVVVPASRTWMYHSLRKRTTTTKNLSVIRTLFQRRNTPSNFCYPTFFESANVSRSLPVAFSSSSQGLDRRSNTMGTTKMAAITTTTTALRGGGRGGGGASASTAPGEPVPATTINEGCSKLRALRKKMHALNLDVYIVPSDDPHLSEYVPDAYKRRAYLSGFTGSAGTCVITHEEAFLWTDSRYWNEATLQLNAKQWTLIKSGATPDVLTIPQFLSQRAVQHFHTTSTTGTDDTPSTIQDATEKVLPPVPVPLRVGLDPFVFAATFPETLEHEFAKTATRAGIPTTTTIGMIDTTHSTTNLVDDIWGDERPAVPVAPFRVHPLQYAGVTVAEKIATIRQQMTHEKTKATLAIFCTLDDVAYLCNLRATGDIATCPVGIAYATVTDQDTILYCDRAKIAASSSVQEHLAAAAVTVRPYEAIVHDVQQHVQQSRDHKVWLDRTRSNYKLSSLVPTEQLVDAQTSITPMKAIKNTAELDGMRLAHAVDGAAMAKFMAWLDHEIRVLGRRINEVDLDTKLTAFRAEQPGFVELSFPTIAGVGSNGAIIHYSASNDKPELLQSLDIHQPILIDSGGQYKYGTTDVTRTWYFGTVSVNNAATTSSNTVVDDDYIDSYTRVLKGNIAVDTMIFPENTPGFVLDVFARKSLWENGKDYGHGTGHGVGAALNVHEGPMSISPRWGNTECLKAGMVVSNEPGYYKDGAYGIRIENLLEIQNVPSDDDENESNGGDGKKKFFQFKKLTMIPIQKNLINVKLLSDDELDWLDSYHKEVYQTVSPLLEQDSPAMAWLAASCSKMERK